MVFEDISKPQKSNFIETKAFLESKNAIRQ